MTINSDNKDKATVIQINVSWIQSEICPPFSEAFDNDLVKYATAAPPGKLSSTITGEIS